MSSNRTVIVTAVSLLGVLAVVNYVTASWLKNDSARKMPDIKAISAVDKISRKAQTEAPNGQTYPLIPSDPAKYGIISVTEGQMPKEQMEWDAFMQKAIVRSGLLETEVGKRAVAEMRTSRERFDNTMQRVDAEISVIEKQKQTNPEDTFTAERLQTLYKLKALAKALQDKAAVLPQARDLPVPTHAVDPSPVVPAGTEIISVPEVKGQ